MPECFSSLNRSCLLRRKTDSVRHIWYCSFEVYACFACVRTHDQCCESVWTSVHMAMSFYLSAQMHVEYLCLALSINGKYGLTLKIIIQKSLNSQSKRRYLNILTESWSPTWRGQTSCLFHLNEVLKFYNHVAKIQDI